MSIDSVTINGTVHYAAKGRQSHSVGQALAEAIAAAEPAWYAGRDLGVELLISAAILSAAFAL